MIIQTAPTGTPRLAIMMYEHTALCQQFAHAFGNGLFEPLAPLDLMVYVISHHDAGWLAFDRDPVIDEKTGLPYNLAETPIQHISVTSRLSPEFNQRHHPFCGLISSMHSWGLYNGRYGLSKWCCWTRSKIRTVAGGQVAQRRADRQKRLKAEIADEPRTSGWLEERRLFQNYKQLQFIDTLALYFNRIHPTERMHQEFENVPMSTQKDVTITIRPAGRMSTHCRRFPLRRTQASLRSADNRRARSRRRQGRLARRLEAGADSVGTLPARGGLMATRYAGYRSPRRLSGA